MPACATPAGGELLLEPVALPPAGLSSRLMRFGSRLQKRYRSGEAIEVSHEHMVNVVKIEVVRLAKCSRLLMGF